MRKVLLTIASMTLLMSCNQGNKTESDNKAKEDSLQALVNQKDDEINELMGTMNEIQDGFAQINAAEGRVTQLKDGVEGANTADLIRENMEFIQSTMAENKRKIAELENRINAGNVNAANLKEMLKKMNEELNTKTKEIEELREQLAEKNVQIEQLSNDVNELIAENEEVRQQKEETEQIARNQDAQLNTAWYVFGTSKELKEHNILVKGNVLQGNYDKNYLTKIDIRNTTVIPLDSKSAELLTTHPSGSYTLLKDNKGEYTLRITDASKFWSVSKYLVVKVK